MTIIIIFLLVGIGILFFSLGVSMYFFNSTFKRKDTKAAFGIRLFIVLPLLVVFSCSNKVELSCPQDIAEKAFYFAEEYETLGSEYGWGVQDPLPRSIKVDCSGLVVRCYEYALENTPYGLPFIDASSTAMYTTYSYPTTLEKLRKGDLLFMGDSESAKVSHIALFEKLENDKINFIDSTQKDDINGVTRRSYSKDDKRFKAFGVMKLIY